MTRAATCPGCEQAIDGDRPMLCSVCGLAVETAEEHARSCECPACELWTITWRRCGALGLSLDDVMVPGSTT